MPRVNVKGVEASLGFHLTRLSFTCLWRYNEDGRSRVAQVERRAARSPWPSVGRKNAKGLIFVALNVEPPRVEAALDTLRSELETKGVSTKEGSWDYKILIVDDLDGNQLFFNYPSETAASQSAKSRKPSIDSLLTPGG